MIPVRNIANTMLHAASRAGFRAFRHAESSAPMARKPNQPPIETPPQAPCGTAHFVFTRDGDLIPCDERGHPLVEPEDEPSPTASSKPERHAHPAA